MDHFEAARLFGFRVDVVLPATPARAMKAIGNAVAPASVFVIIVNSVIQANWPKDAFLGVEFEVHLLALLYGQRPLMCFERVSDARLTFLRLGGLHIDLMPWESHVGMLWVSGALPLTGYGAAKDGLFHQRCDLLPYGAAWPVAEVQCFLREDVIYFYPFFRLGCLRLESALLRSQPWWTVGDIVLLFPLSARKHALAQIGLRRDVSIGFSSGTNTFSLHGSLVEDLQQVVLLCERDRRVTVEWRGKSFAQVLDEVFPYHMSGQVWKFWDAIGKEYVPLHAAASAGVFQVFFRPVKYLVEPFGFFCFHPLMSVTQVQQFLGFFLFRWSGPCSSARRRSFR